MQGFISVAVPFITVRDADIGCKRGKEMYDFVMFLNSKSLKVVYLLQESHFINRKNGNRFVWGKNNPYRAVLLKLKEFWRELPESAEMPTVMIGLEMNRWNDKNVDRPSGLLFTWRKEKNKKGSSNDLMFLKSMKYFDECREILDLEQKILLVDEEVMIAGESGYLSGGSVAELLQKCDALAIQMEAQHDGSIIEVKSQFLKNIKDKGAVFIVVSPKMKEIGVYKNWLSSLADWKKSTGKFTGTAGLWVRDWKKLNKLWRSEK